MLFRGEQHCVDAAGETHLAFGSDAYVSIDRRVGPQVDWLLDADISEGILSEDGTSVKVGSHEAAETGQSLVGQRQRRYKTETDREANYDSV